MEIHYTIDESTDSEEYNEAVQGLFDHAAKRGHETNFGELHVFARDASGNMVGACGGQITWEFLSIDLMWVRPELRGQGIGAALLLRTEAEASLRGCFRIHLDTMTFQAPTFYARLGYREFARMEGYRDGASRIYYVKELEQSVP